MKTGHRQRDTPSDHTHGSISASLLFGLPGAPLFTTILPRVTVAHRNKTTALNSYPTPPSKSPSTRHGPEAASCASAMAVGGACVWYVISCLGSLPPTLIIFRTPNAKPHPTAPSLRICSANLDTRGPPHDSVTHLDLDSDSDGSSEHSSQVSQISQPASQRAARGVPD